MNGRKMKFSISGILIFIFLCIFGILVLIPLVMGLMDSLKTSNEIALSATNLPKSFNLNNYAQAFVIMKFWQSTLNTLIITVFSVAGILVLSSMAGYKLSRSKGVMSGILFFLIISSMMIPFMVIMIPLIKEASILRMSNQLWGLILVYIGVGINMPIFLYHGFVKSIPLEIEDAALIDGCSDWKMFTNIIFPMLKPINVTVAIILIMWIWNDFLLPLVYISSPNHYTLILSTQAFYSLYSTSWELVLAGNFMAAIPVIVFYLVFQNNIQQGIAAGALKG